MSESTEIVLLLISHHREQRHVLPQAQWSRCRRDGSVSTARAMGHGGLTKGSWQSFRGLCNSHQLVFGPCHRDPDGRTALGDLRNGRGISENALLLRSGLRGTYGVEQGRLSDVGDT